MIPASFAYHALAADIRFGREQAQAHLSAQIGLYDARRILVVTSASRSKLAERITAGIRDRIARYFTDVAEHVPAAAASAARRAAAESKADLILSVGGGSSTGTAKAIALETSLPIVAVPTTLSGSEMTDVWGITEDGRKQTGSSPKVRPQTVVYDSALFDGIPYDLAVSSAYNALAHCLEAFWAAGANPLTSLVATEGVRNLTIGLQRLGQDGTEAIEHLVYGSFLAGKSFAEAGSGLHHKICHVLGGAFGLSHRGTHTVLLPHIMAFNGEAVPEASEAVRSALGVGDAAAGLSRLVAATGAPLSLRELGMRREDLSLATDAIAEKFPIQNPRVVNRAEIQRLLQAAFDEGEKP